MNQEEDNHSKANAKWLFVSGLSVGWLAGLSVSPIIATIMTAALAALAGVFAGLNSTEKNRRFINAAPVGIFLVGIAIAAPVGVLVRTHCLLEKNYVCDTKGNEKQIANSSPGVGLFNTKNIKSDWCSKAQRSPDNTLLHHMTSRDGVTPELISIMKTLDTPAQQRRIVEVLCEN